MRILPISSYSSNYNPYLLWSCITNIEIIYIFKKIPISKFSLFLNKKKKDKRKFFIIKNCHVFNNNMNFIIYPTDGILILIEV